MSHECFVCGQTCYCSGDIDDFDCGEVVLCTCCDDMQDDDDLYNDDDIEMFKEE